MIIFCFLMHSLYFEFQMNFNFTSTSFLFYLARGLSFAIIAGITSTSSRPFQIHQRVKILVQFVYNQYWKFFSPFLYLRKRHTFSLRHKHLTGISLHPTPPPLASLSNIKKRRVSLRVILFFLFFLDPLIFLSR